MNRKLGSVISTVALLSIAVAAAAVNVRILHSNRGEASVLSVQPAADVTSMDVAQPATADVTAASAEPVATPDPSPTSVAVDPAPSPSPSTASVAPKPAPKTNGKSVLGRVAGGGDDDGEGDEDGEHEDGDGRFGDGQPRRQFIPLSPSQQALLRVSALARVTPQVARDAAKGTGSADVVARVQSAAQQIGVPLSELAAVTNLPPERGRGHGGHDGEPEGDDDD